MAYVVCILRISVHFRQLLVDIIYFTSPFLARISGRSIQMCSTTIVAFKKVIPKIENLISRTIFSKCIPDLIYDNNVRDDTKKLYKYKFNFLLKMLKYNTETLHMQTTIFNINLSPRKTCRNLSSRIDSIPSTILSWKPSRRWSKVDSILNVLREITLKQMKTARGNPDLSILGELKKNAF